MNLNIRNSFDTSLTEVSSRHGRQRRIFTWCQCFLPWDCDSPRPGDKQLKTSPGKPIKQRLVILSLQAGSVPASHSAARVILSTEARCWVFVLWALPPVFWSVLWLSNQKNDGSSLNLKEKLVQNILNRVLKYQILMPFVRYWHEYSVVFSSECGWYEQHHMNRELSSHLC